MAIPGFQTVMLPLLQALDDGAPHNVGELTNILATNFQLTQQERSQRLQSGRSSVFVNRVAWARVYLGMAGVLESPARGVVQITPRGQDLLAAKPAHIDVRLLMRYPEFAAFRRRTGAGATTTAFTESVTAETPEEVIARAHAQLEATLADELLSRIKSEPPEFFEKLVLDLLVRMGYGGTVQDAAQQVGRAGDGGIDGVIKEDRLGLDMIYVQAKRWDNSVGRPVVQAFAGSLQGVSASKGVLITTATFTADARHFVERLATRIVLIDGPTLARLMIEHNVGVSLASTYLVKRMDSDYFSEAP